METIHRPGLINTNVDTDEEVTKVTITVTSESGKDKDYVLAIRKISTDNTGLIYVDGVLIKPDADGNYIAKVLETNTEALIKVVPNSKFASAEVEGFDPETPETEQTITLGKDKTQDVGITITSQSGDANNITLTIVKVSNEVGINEIRVGSKEVTIYDEDTKTYTAYVPSASDLNNIYVMAKHSEATVIVEDVAGKGFAEKKDADTSAEETRVKITIKAEDGTTQDYTLVILKESADVSITEIRVNDSEPLTAPYEVYVKNTDTKAKLYVKTTSEKAKIQIGDEPETEHEQTVYIDLPEGTDNVVVTVIVKAQDGSKTESYPVKLIRQSNNTNIKEIIVNGEVIELNENLEAIIKNTNTSEMKVTLEDENAFVQIDSSEKEKGVITKSIDTPVTTVRTITVTAQDGTTKEYQITLIKKFTIIGKITDEFVTDNHIAKVTVYQNADTRDERDETNPREKVLEVETNPDGTYELVLDAGTYDVVITKPGYLRHKITKIMLKGENGVDLGTKDLIAGDVVESDEINLSDLVGMNERYKKDVTKFPEYDLNGDGIIDLLDRKLITKNYGKLAVEEEWVDPEAEEEIASIAEDEIQGEETNETKTPEETDKDEDLAEEVTTEEFVLPLDSTYVVTSEFGTRISPTSEEEEEELHKGIDLRGKHHSNVLSTADGIVTFAGVQNGYGNCIEIKHEINGKVLYSFYAHLSELKVEKGDNVKQGDVIALEGGEPGVDENAGDSTGHHLHFEIRTNSGAQYAVNPRKYIEF